MMQATISWGQDRIYRSVDSLDNQLKSQQKAREQERKAFQQDVFLRSRELESQLARRQAPRLA
jgi:hypothetical protein